MPLAARAEQLLGTTVEIKLPSRHSALFSACFSELARIEAAYSRFLPNSKLSSLNSNLGVWQDATDEMLFLVSKAEEFRAKSDGNFDITLKSRLEELGYGPKCPSLKKSQKPAPFRLPDFFPRAIKVDLKKRKILLRKEIEFGGLGKGFALDKVSELLEKNGVHHYYINAGGDIYAKQGAGEPPWEILLEHPGDPSRAIGKVLLNWGSIAGSAPNRRRWGECHHLLNAKTGLPAKGAKAIFAIAKTGMEADAYATALFTAGFEDGIRLSKNLPVEILIISDNNKMYQSNGFGAELFE